MTTAVIASDDGAPSPADLITDRLYRSPGADTGRLAASREEAGRLVVIAIGDESLATEEDRAWLVEDIAERASLDIDLAEARVQMAFSAMAIAGEEARKGRCGPRRKCHLRHRHGAGHDGGRLCC